MSDFNRGDFLYDRKYLSKKYIPIGGYTEAIVYKVNDELVVKRFNEIRNPIIKSVHDTIIECNPQAILTSNDFLIQDNKVYAQFLKYFKGEQKENVYDISFDVLTKFVKEILVDIQALTEMNVQMQDITPSSFIYSDKDMKLIDTTKYGYSDMNQYDLYKHNMRTLFFESRYFDFDLNDSSNIIKNIIKITQDSDLELMRYNYEDYYYFLKELRRVLQDSTGVKVNTINEGYSLIKHLK